MNNVIYVFKCVNSTLTVKGKVNNVVFDSCKKCSLLFDSVVSSIEFVNCQSVQMQVSFFNGFINYKLIWNCLLLLQVLGKVPTISIDKTDGCQMYLSSDSLAVEIVSSKSSEMNVLIPRADGEFVSFFIVCFINFNLTVCFKIPVRTANSRAIQNFHQGQQLANCLRWKSWLKWKRNATRLTNSRELNQPSFNNKKHKRMILNVFSFFVI